MKKVILSTVLVLTLGICANAQKDSFFTDWDDVSNGLDRPGIEMPALPGTHGDSSNVSAPLGSGLLILTAIGAGYTLSRKKRLQ